MESFSMIPPINISEGGERLLAVTSFEVTNSVFSIPDEKTKFSVSPPSRWSSGGGPETLNRLQNLIKL